MNVLDSSAWLEYFANGPNAEIFAPVLERFDELVVPTITIYEVFKRLLQQRDEDFSLTTMAKMYKGEIVALDRLLAIRAAELSSQHALPMADSIILATSREHGAVLWTQDADFESIPDVNYIPKKK